MKPKVWAFFEEYVELCKKHRMHISCASSGEMDAWPYCYINYVTQYVEGEGWACSEGSNVPAEEILEHLYELLNEEKETVSFKLNEDGSIHYDVDFGIRDD